MTDPGIDDRATMRHYKAQAEKAGGRSEWALRFLQCMAKLEREWSRRDKNFGDGYAAATANMLAILETLEVREERNGSLGWNDALQTAAQYLWAGQVNDGIVDASVVLPKHGPHRPPEFQGGDAADAARYLRKLDRA